MKKIKNYILLPVLLFFFTGILCILGDLLDVQFLNYPNKLWAILIISSLMFCFFIGFILRLVIKDKTMFRRSAIFTALIFAFLYFLCFSIDYFVGIPYILNLLFFASPIATLLTQLIGSNNYYLGSILTILFSPINILIIIFFYYLKPPQKEF